MAQGAADGKADNGISEIVVTATRQAEVLSKVSQSVTALNEKALDVRGIKGVADISRLTPGIELNPNGFGSQADISIRGISSQVGAATTGIYIDDTPIQTRIVGYSATNTYPLVFDLDRVEVLRGPQGTLFGSGSEGGTIRFITPEPSLTKYSAYVRSEVSGTKGGDPSYEGGVAVGGPIKQDVLGFRLSIWDRHDGGYVDRKNANPDLNGAAPVEKNANWSDTQVARLALTYAPFAHLTITPSLFYQDRQVHDIGTYWEGYSAAGAGKFVNGQPLAQPDHDRFILPALKIQYEFSGMTLISNTSMYQRKDTLQDDYSTLVPAVASSLVPPELAIGNFVPGDTGYSAYARMVNKQSVWTEELRLQSSDKTSRVTWVAGLFMSESRQKAYENIVDPRLGEITGIYGLSVQEFWGMPLIDNKYSLIAAGKAVDRQTALFGEVNYHLTEQIKLTAGLRVARASFMGEGFGTGAFVGQPIVQPASKTTETPVTPKFGISYQYDNNNLLYVSAAKGYRIGGANSPVGDSCGADLTAQGYNSMPNTFASDSVWSYELGAKNKLFNRKLEINSSIYHIDWKSIQQVVYLSHCAQQFVDNLGQASSDGFDVQLAAHPIDGLTIEASVGYTNATFSKSVKTLVQKGDHIETQPWSGTLGVTYDAKVFGDYDGFVRADYTYHSKSALTSNRDPANGSYDPAALPTPSTNYLTLRGGLRWSGYDVSLFIDNVTNEHPNLTRYSEVLGNPVHRDFTFRPLTVGLTAAYRY
ncbi:MAG: TonB-dependent receptor [Caulobacteraceae bacterium]|nr:TonB-dependent receptor [Caulobacteraceae bacterium]